MINEFVAVSLFGFLAVFPAAFVVSSDLKLVMLRPDGKPFYGDKDAD